MSVTGENTDKTWTSNWRWSVSVVPQHLQLFFQFLSLWLFSNSSVKVKNKIFLGRSICTSRRSRGICEQAAQKLLRLSTSYNLVEMSRRWGKTRIEKWNFISWANMYQHPLRAWLPRGWGVVTKYPQSCSLLCHFTCRGMESGAGQKTPEIFV